jgi:chloramphenicol-sensitive protein RarD
MDAGYFYALMAYLIWGLFPIYWQPLEAIPATQLIGHRIVWSFVFMVAFLVALRQTRRLKPLLRERRVVLTYGFAGLLLAGNWLTYVWGVTHGHIVEASLGYFINPLFSVLLGLLVLKERLRRWQWLAVGLAAAGVAYLTWSYGRLPWIALALTLTFGLYGLVTKTAALDAIDGLTLETGLLFLPALAFLLWTESQGRGAFGHAGALANAMMIGTGVVTAVPLLFFGAAARRVPLNVLGILQYLAPTLQFLLGVLAYHEPFTRTHLVGYGLVWLALLIFWVEGGSQRRRQTRQVAPET